MGKRILELNPGWKDGGDISVESFTSSEPAIDVFVIKQTPYSIALYKGVIIVDSLSNISEIARLYPGA